MNLNSPLTRPQTVCNKCLNKETKRIRALYLRNSINSDGFEWSDGEVNLIPFSVKRHQSERCQKRRRCGAEREAPCLKCKKFRFTLYVILERVPRLEKPLPKLLLKARNVLHLDIKQTTPQIKYRIRNLRKSVAAKKILLVHCPASKRSCYWANGTQPCPVASVLSDRSLIKQDIADAFPVLPCVGVETETSLFVR